jgi:hypothetical protein
MYTAAGGRKAKRGGRRQARDARGAPRQTATPPNPFFVLLSPPPLFAFVPVTFLTKIPDIPRRNHDRTPPPKKTLYNFGEKKNHTTRELNLTKRKNSHPATPIHFLSFGRFLCPAPNKTTERPKKRPTTTICEINKKGETKKKCYMYKKNAETHRGGKKRDGGGKRRRPHFVSLCDATCGMHISRPPCFSPLLSLLLLLTPTHPASHNQQQQQIHAKL